MSSALLRFYMIKIFVEYYKSFASGLFFTAKISSSGSCHSNNFDQSIFIQPYPRWDKTDRGAYEFIDEISINSLTSWTGWLSMMSAKTALLIGLVYCVLLEAKHCLSLNVVVFLNFGGMKRLMFWSKPQYE